MGTWRGQVQVRATRNVGRGSFYGRTACESNQVYYVVGFLVVDPEGVGSLRVSYLTRFRITRSKRF
jgi:hypothetical protein